MLSNSEKDTCGLALVAFGCTLGGLVSLVVCTVNISCIFVLVGNILFILGLVLGVISTPILIGKHQEVKGAFFAVFAILLSLPAIIGNWPLMVSARAAHRVAIETSGAHNLQILSDAIFNYAEANGGVLPNADSWCDQLIEFDDNLSKENFRHPQAGRYGFVGQCQFGFNKNISGMQLRDIPDNVVLLIEADGQWNLSGAEDLIETRRRNQFESILVILADSTSVSCMLTGDSIRVYSSGWQPVADQLRWKGN